MTIRRKVIPLYGRTIMQQRSLIGTLALAAALCLAVAGALAQPTEKYPDWKGQWIRIGGGQYDPSKPGGRRQAPPLTTEYQAIWESRLKAEGSGSQDYN